MAENFAAGIGPAIQTFLQMRQYMGQEHARKQADQAGAGAYAAYAGMGEPPAGAQAAPKDDTPPPPPIAPPQMSGMGLPGSQPMPPGGAGGPPPSANIASILQALAAHGGGQGGPPPPQAMQPQGGGGPGGVQAMQQPQQPMAPPQQQPMAPPPGPPPRDPNMSSTAQPVQGGDFKDQTSASLAAMARSAKAANPNLKGVELYHVMQSMIEMQKGVAPEAKAYMQSQVGMARVQEQYSALQERADRDQQASADRIAKMEAHTADLEQQLAARHADVQTQQTGATRRTGMQQGGAMARVHEQIAARAKSDNDKLYSKMNEGAKTRANQAAIAAMKKLPKDTDADTVQSTYDTAYGRFARTAGGAGSSGVVGPYATLQDAQAAVAQGKLAPAKAMELARANKWAQ